MDDEDEIQSNGRITVTLAASAPPLPSPSQQQESPQRKNNNNNNNSSAQILTPVPSQQQKQPKSGGGWREDCWSEGATEVLIDAWGERYLELSRGNLKQKHWQEVADIITSRDEYSKPAKSDVQCKNRIDTVKKKYKQEKAKVVAGGGPSKWPFYQQLDRLIGKHTKVTPLVSPAGGGGGGGGGSGRVPVGIPVGRAGGSSNRAGKQSKSNQNAGMQFRKRWMVESESDEEEEEEERSLDSDDDSLPPPKRARRGPMVVGREVNGKGGRGKERKAGSGSSIRMLTLAMLKFGEAYEHAETAKLQQVVEMEKARMKFAKELELQRMQFFVKTQMEISRLKEQGRKGGSNGSNHHGTGGIHNNNSNNANNNSNNSDSDN